MEGVKKGGGLVRRERKTAREIKTDMIKRNRERETETDMHAEIDRV